MSLIAAMGTVGTNILIGHFFSHSESERFQRLIEVVNEGIDQRKKNREEYRQDGFLGGIPTNGSKVKEAIELILKKVRDTTEEPKIDFIGYLTVNVFFDEDLDMDTYRQILKDLDELTYRQLCIIRLATLYENREVIGHIDDEKWQEQIPQNERARFHSISRDFEEMMVDDSYLDGVRGGKTEDGEPCMLRPSLGARHISNKTIVFIREFM